MPTIFIIYVMNYVSEGMMASSNVSGTDLSSLIEILLHKPGCMAWKKMPMSVVHCGRLRSRY